MGGEKAYSSIHPSSPRLRRTLGTNGQWGAFYMVASAILKCDIYRVLVLVACCMSTWAYVDIPTKSESVVMVFGVFDLLHEGHRSFLNQVAACGSRLVIVVTRDSVVQKLKKRTARDNQEVRMHKLRTAFSAATVILGDAELGTYGVIKNYRPDTLCLGYDQDGLRRDLTQRMAAGTLPSIPLIVLKPYKPEQYHTSLLLNTGQT